MVDYKRSCISQGSRFKKTINSIMNCKWSDRLIVSSIGKSSALVYHKRAHITSLSYTMCILNDQRKDKWIILENFQNLQTFIANDS